jgi:hypothetical protein
MATTNRIAALTRSIGQSVSAVIYPGAETIALQLTAQTPFAGSVDHQHRLTVVGPDGTSLGSVVLDGPGTTRLLVTSISVQVLTIELSCLRGTAVAQVDEITGIEAMSGGTTIDTDDIVDASIATAKFAAGAVTLAKVSGFATLKCLAAVGVAAPGPCACVGAAVGDRVVAVFGSTTITGQGLGGLLNDGTQFEQVISVINEIQQAVAVDLSLRTHIVLLAPAAA